MPFRRNNDQEPRDTISRIGNTFGKQVVEVEQSKEKGPLGLWTKSKTVTVKYAPDPAASGSASGSDDPPSYQAAVRAAAPQDGAVGNEVAFTGKQVVQTSIISSVVTGVAVVGLFVAKRIWDGYETASKTSGSKGSE